MVSASHVLDRVLVLEMVRVTEAAAIAASKWIGRGDNDAADAAAVEAMRAALNELPMDGTVVIGEGERDEAPMLYIGEKVGSANGDGPAIFGPFAPGATVKITEAPGATPASRAIGGPNSAVAAHLQLDSDPVVFAVDAAGHDSERVSCLVPPPPK